MQGTSIELMELSYWYEDVEQPALHGVSLTIPAGQFTAVIGPGGSGKSTLCQLLSGYLPRSGGGRREGKVQLDAIDPAEAPIAEIAKVAGIVFQDPDAQLVRGVVEDEAAFGPENLRVPPAEIESRVEEALAAVNLTARRRSPVRELSGGQRQRTAIAAVLSLSPRMIVFDDASASLDPAAQAQFVQLCRRLHAEGRTVVTVSGRFDDAARAAERVIVLDGGAVLLDGAPQELLRTSRDRLAQLGVLPPWEGAAEAGGPAGGRRGVPEAGAHAAEPATGTLQSAGMVTAPAKRPPGNDSPGGAPASGPLLEVRNLSYTYPGGQEALRDVSFAMHPGAWGMLTGENGSGKTTLTRLLMGLLPVPARSVYWKGRDVSGMPVHQLARDIGYVFQQPEHQFVEHTVWDELVYSLRIRSGWRRRQTELTPEQTEAAEALLAAAGLSGRRQDSPYLLSQGEKKLLSVIGQLIQPKALYILDEPTSGIDYRAAQRLLKLCRGAAAQGAALLMITHDPRLVEEDASFVLRLNHGMVEDYRQLGRSHELMQARF
ncbi:energy-coupling factor transport system ATP-binding protein [Paenibacillus rhizosphaerae]|uniref:Energy-coupling factor transport system ATP-binding protein n=1 Tax=Paenibacillus rhizosphaerae TaxID=297318 RepID=A0A839U0I8_9BACL|nr:energy-coupling factor transporter ATPase [Paenibacillus rhizosphaerae]MBB3130397.1 energy-coupling factor transport system ATP-binding protein [Paenibacillus rhizosphaerae]